MSRYDDEDDDFTDDPNANTPLVKNLRRQLNEAKKQAAEAAERAEKVERVNRQRTVADTLKDKGVNPALSRFVLQDLNDPTPDAVNTWLVENGELFGVKPKASVEQALGLPSGTELPPDLVAAYERFANGQGGGTRTPDVNAGLAAKLNDPTLTQEQLLAIIQSAA